MKKSICLFIILSYALTMLSSPWVEAGFWEERRKTAKTKLDIRNSKLKNTNDQLPIAYYNHFASFPVKTQQLLQQMPAINIQPINNLSSAFKDQLIKLPKELFNNLAPLINGLPQQYGSIRKISIASNGQCPISKFDHSPIVIHIQDIHQNLEAQKNIAAAIESFLETINQKKKNNVVQGFGPDHIATPGGLDHKKHDTSPASRVPNIMIALEAAFAPLKLKRFHAFPHKDTMKIVADDLLKNNLISGPVYAAFTTQSDLVPYIGIDDHYQYNQNVQAYLNSLKTKAQDKKHWETLKQQLDTKKKGIYNSDLFDFDQHAQSYHEGRVSLGKHIKTLGQDFRFEHSPLSPIHQFLMALALEKSLDYKQVKKERSQIIQKLTQKAMQKDLSELVNQSMAYRLGQTKYTTFYQFLQKLCKRKGIRLKKYPAMKDYIAYILLSDQIDPEKLHHEIHELEKQTYHALARTPEEKALVQESRHMCLEGKLLDFTLTPKEWREYKSNDGLRMMNDKKVNLKTYEAFYEYAEKRNKSMADNLIKSMEKHRTNVAVLVTGGFHSQGIESILTNQNVSVINFVPKITKLDTTTGSAYLSVFSQEKTPIQKLFEAEKLFVAQTPLNQTAGMRGCANAVSMEAKRDNGMPWQRIVGYFLKPETIQKIRQVKINITIWMTKIIFYFPTKAYEFTEKKRPNGQNDVNEKLLPTKAEYLQHMAKASVYYLSIAMGVILGRSAAQNVRKQETPMRIADKPLGNTGLKFYPLGLGTIWMGRRWPPENENYSDPVRKEVDAALLTAFECMKNANGVIMLDTAAAYGKSEERIGDFLRRHPNLDKRAFVATKWGEDFDLKTEKSTHDHSVKNLKKSFQRSQERLGQVDLLYIHGTSCEVLRDSQVMAEMKSLKTKGEVKAIGASISRRDVLQEALTHGLLTDLDVVQMPAGLFDACPGLIKELRKLNIAIIANSLIRKSAENEGPGEKIQRFVNNPNVSVVLTGSRHHLNETIGYTQQSLKPNGSAADKTQKNNAGPAGNKSGRLMSWAKTLIEFLIKAAHFVIKKLRLRGPPLGVFYEVELEEQLNPFASLSYQEAWEKLKNTNKLDVLRLHKNLESKIVAKGLFGCTVMERHLYVSVYLCVEEIRRACAKKSIFLSGQYKRALQNESFTRFSDIMSIVYANAIQQGEDPADINRKKPFKNPRKIFLIAPYHQGEHKPNQFLIPPYGLHRIAEFLRAFGQEVKVYDPHLDGVDGFEKRLREFQPNIIGFSPLHATLQEDITLMHTAKKILPRAQIVLGGVETSGLKSMDPRASKTDVSIDFINNKAKPSPALASLLRHRKVMIDLSGKLNKDDPLVQKTINCLKKLSIQTAGLYNGTDDWIKTHQPQARLTLKSVAHNKITFAFNPIILWPFYLPEQSELIYGLGEYPLLDMALGFEFNAKGTQYDEKDFHLVTKILRPEKIPYEEYWDMMAQRMSQKDLEKGRMGTFIKTGRGFFQTNCDQNCVFCSSRWVNDFFGLVKGVFKRQHHASVLLAAKDVVDMVESTLKAHPEMEAYYFNDDTFDPKRAEAIADLIVQRGLNKKLQFFIQTRVDKINPKLLTKLKQAGFYLIGYGVETTVPHVLKEMNKATYDFVKTDKVLQATQEAGIVPRILLILFYPTVKLDDLRKTMWDFLNFSNKGGVLDLHLFVNAYSGAGIMNKPYPLALNEIEIKTSQGRVAIPMAQRFLPIDEQVRQIAESTETRKPAVMAEFGFKNKKAPAPVNSLITLYTVCQVCEDMGITGFPTQEIQNAIQRQILVIYGEELQADDARLQATQAKQRIFSNPHVNVLTIVENMRGEVLFKQDENGFLSLLEQDARAGRSSESIAFESLVTQGVRPKSINPLGIVSDPNRPTPTYCMSHVMKATVKRVAPKKLLVVVPQNEIQINQINPEHRDIVQKYIDGFDFMDLSQVNGQIKINEQKRIHEPPLDPMKFKATQEAHQRTLQPAHGIDVLVRAGGAGFVAIKRASGQMAFPGGMAFCQESLWQTGLKKLFQEIGLRDVALERVLRVTTDPERDQKAYVWNTIVLARAPSEAVQALEANQSEVDEIKVFKSFEDFIFPCLQELASQLLEEKDRHYRVLRRLLNHIVETRIITKDQVLTIQKIISERRRLDKPSVLWDDHLQHAFAFYQYQVDQHERELALVLPQGFEIPVPEKWWDHVFLTEAPALPLRAQPANLFWHLPAGTGVLLSGLMTGNWLFSLMSVAGYVFIHEFLAHWAGAKLKGENPVWGRWGIDCYSFISPWKTTVYTMNMHLWTVLLSGLPLMVLGLGLMPVSGSLAVTTLVVSQVMTGLSFVPWKRLLRDFSNRELPDSDMDRALGDLKEQAMRKSARALLILKKTIDQNTDKIKNRKMGLVLETLLGEPDVLHVGEEVVPAEKVFNSKRFQEILIEEAIKMQINLNEMTHSLSNVVREDMHALEGNAGMQLVYLVWVTSEDGVKACAELAAQGEREKRSLYVMAMTNKQSLAKKLQAVSGVVVGFEKDMLEGMDVKASPMYQLMIKNGIHPNACHVRLRPIIPIGHGVHMAGVPKNTLGELLAKSVRLILMSIESGESKIMEISAEGLDMYKQHRNAVLSAA